MSARARVYLAMLGTAVLGLSIAVAVRNRSVDHQLLAAIGHLGGVAILVVAVVVPGPPPDR